MPLLKNGEEDLARESLSRKKTFNGTDTLNCANHEEQQAIKQKKKTKWRLVLYKDGEKVGKKSKKGKSRLFKKKD